MSDATGEVYVVDRGNNRVEIFSSTGAYISQFDGSAAPTGVFSSPTAIAVDNSASPLDPSAGDVYVLDAGHDVIDKFSASGVYQGQLTEAAAGSKFGALDGVGVDSSGEVWVYQASNEIDNFNDSLSNEFISGRSSPFGTNPGFAVDSEDNLYVLRGEPQFAKLNRAGAVLSETVDPGPSSAAAVEPASNDVYIDDLVSVGVFGPTGALVERFGAGQLTSGAGIAVYPGNGAVYVADSADNKIDVFIPEAPSPPTVKSVFTKSVTPTSARVYAQIEPHGAQTTYYFQYGTGDCTVAPSSCTDLPAPPGALAAGFGTQTVNVQLNNLAPDATYHYRVVAESTLGHAASEDQTFTTQRSSEAPTAIADGRAWELVSPANKHGANIEPLLAEDGVVQAAEDGSAIAYLANGAIAEKPEGNANFTQVLSTRGSSGWSSQDIATPHDAQTSLAVGPGQQYRFFSSDLSSALVEPFELGAGVPLSPEASERTIYRRNNTTATCEVESREKTCYQALVNAANVPAGVTFGGNPNHATGEVHFLSATPDLNHVIITSTEALAPPVVNTQQTQLYEWAAGQLQPVSLLPNGKPANAAPTEAAVNLGYQSFDVRHAISNDGARIVWETNTGEPHLYLRDMIRGETIQLDTPEPAAGSGPVSPIFQTANDEASRIFFTDEQALTSGSTAHAGSSDLYEFEVTSAGGSLAGKLIDLTTNVQNAGEHADMQGDVIAASEDGSDVYFVANGVLANGAVPGDCTTTNSGPPPPGATCNLYELHYNGTKWETTFIAALSSEDSPDWSRYEPGNLHHLAARVSPNGRYLAFMSDRSLTGYDNHDANSGQPDEEVFLYDSSTHHLVCASCNPSGARPVGVFDSDNSGLLIDPVPHPVWSEHWLAASIPGWTAVDLSSALYQSRYLSDSGRLFFDSADALVPQDVNGREDVYEYQPEGVPKGKHTCTRSSETFNESFGGCVGLISSGTASGESVFLDASESGGEESGGKTSHEGGGDVFFLTAAQLTSQDHDEQYDVYDAHECTQESPCITLPTAAAPSSCSGSSCRLASTLQIPTSGLPSSVTFSGPENLPAPASKSSKPLTRAQRLANALKACHTKPRKRRRGCEAHARRRYGARAKKQSPASSKRRGR